MGGEGGPKRSGVGVELNKQKNTYIIHLYGWSAWWTWVEKQCAKENKPNNIKALESKKVLGETKLQDRCRKSEVEKKNFLNRYYHVRPKENDGSQNGMFTTKLNVECTPKRLRDFDDFETGEISSQKRRKSEISENQIIGEGLEGNTHFALPNLNNSNPNLDSGECGRLGPRPTL